MNSTALKSNDLAAWREMIEQPAGSHLAAIAAFFLASLLILPFCADQNLSLIYLASAAVLLYFLSRSLSFVIRAGLPAALLLLMVGTPALPAAFVAIAMGGACGTLLMLSCRKKQQYLLLTLLPLAALAATFFLKENHYACLLVLMPLPLAIGGYVLVRRCVAHTESAVIMACLLGVTLLVAGLVALLAMDLLHGNPLTMLRDALTGALTEAVETMRVKYAEAGITLPIDDSLVENTVTLVVNMLPGLFGLVCLLTAYWGYRLTLQMMRGLGMVPRLPLRMQVLVISPVAASLFLIAYLVSMIADSDGATLVGAVAANFLILLEPGLALTGLLSLTGGQERSCLSSLLFFALLAGMFVNPAIVFSLAAFLGAVHILIQSCRRRAAKK